MDRLEAGLFPDRRSNGARSIGDPRQDGRDMRTRARKDWARSDARTGWQELAERGSPGLVGTGSRDARVAKNDRRQVMQQGHDRYVWDVVGRRAALPNYRTDRALGFVVDWDVEVVRRLEMGPIIGFPRAARETDAQEHNPIANKDAMTETGNAMQCLSGPRNNGERGDQQPSNRCV